jgi:hypothetical protein
MYTIWTITSSRVLAVNDDLDKTLNVRSWLKVASLLRRGHEVEDRLRYAYSGFNKLVLVFKGITKDELTPYRFLLGNCIQKAFSDCRRYVTLENCKTEFHVRESIVYHIEDVLYYVKDLSTFHKSLGEQLGISVTSNNSLTGAAINLTKPRARPRYNKDSFTPCLNELLKAEGLANSEGESLCLGE